MSSYDLLSAEVLNAADDLPHLAINEPRVGWVDRNILASGQHISRRGARTEEELQTMIVQVVIFKEISNDHNCY